FNGAWRAAVTNEIGPELAVAGAPEWHVVAENFDLSAVLFDYGEGIVGAGGLDRVVEFDVGDLGSPANRFLYLGRDAVPGIQLVEILLNDYIASTGENRIFVANKNGLGGSVACGVFGSVHEPQKIALVEVAECLDFVDRSDRACQPRQDLRSE